MSQAELAGVSRRKFVVTTVKGDGRQPPDSVERDFTAAAVRRRMSTRTSTWLGQTRSLERRRLLDWPYLLTQRLPMLAASEGGHEGAEGEPVGAGRRREHETAG
jgi:hypothetical protein